MCFTSTWVRYARSGSGLKVKTLVQLFRKAVADSVCLISSSVSRCYQSRLLYFLWRPDWVWPFCRGARGLYESLNDCSALHRMHRFQWLFSPGAAYLCRPQDGNWGGAFRKASCCSKEYQSGDKLSCAILYSLQGRETAALCCVPYLPWVLLLSLIFLTVCFLLFFYPWVSSFSALSQTSKRTWEWLS